MCVSVTGIGIVTVVIVVIVIHVGICHLDIRLPRRLLLLLVLQMLLLLLLLMLMMLLLLLLLDALPQRAAPAILQMRWSQGHGRRERSALVASVVLVHQRVVVDERHHIILRSAVNIQVVSTDLCPLKQRSVPNNIYARARTDMNAASTIARVPRPCTKARITFQLTNSSRVPRNAVVSSLLAR